ncbi:MAG: ROK family protein [archaeon]
MKLAIGIDLGGTKISGVLMNEKGKVLKKYSRPTEAQKSKSEVLDNIAEVINSFKRKGVKGVGVATPGFVLPDGKLSLVRNIPSLEGALIKKDLEKRTKLKVVIENDANCFALAEQRMGAAKGHKYVVGVIIGTGVGSGIIIDGKIYRGVLGGAGEIGHTKIMILDKIKDVESLISGPSLMKRYEELSGKILDNPKELVELIGKDDDANKVYAEFILYAGLFFANIINTFNPGCIVVGGGVSNVPFYDRVLKVAEKYSNSFMFKACKIVKNKLGADSGVLGAAQLVL